jgi:hypothetical protein
MKNRELLRKIWVGIAVIMIFGVILMMVAPALLY